MAGRTNKRQITDAEFSSLLQALSANPKGRSFLAEYRKRVRPDELGSLLEAIGRIETAVDAVRDQLQPKGIAEELRRIGMTLEIAVDGAASGPDDSEARSRLALVARARSELATLAEALAGSAPLQSRIDLDANLGPDHFPNLGGSVESRRALLRQAAEETAKLLPDL